MEEPRAVTRGGSEAGEQKAEYWRGQIALWQQSGESQVQFCRRRGLSRDQFCYWKSRLSPGPGNGAAIVAVPVGTAALESAEGARIGIQVAEGRYWVEVPEGFGQQTLRRVLEVLEAGH